MAVAKEVFVENLFFLHPKGHKVVFEKKGKGTKIDIICFPRESEMTVSIYVLSLYII